MLDEIKLFVPGRLCLFGEHSDWAGGHRRQNSEIEKGYAIVAPTNQGNHALVRKLSNPVIRFKSSIDSSFELPLDESVLSAEATRGGFFSYVAGVAYQAISDHHNVGGIEIDNYKSDLPIKKGLSSSASICVLVARAFNQLYNLGWKVKREMDMAYAGETTTPSRCGRLDQACAFNHPVLMTFDADNVATENIRVQIPLYLVVVDLTSKKDTKKILAELNKGFPFPTNDFERKKHKYLGEINKSIVKSAVSAIKRGDAEEVGRLMTKAQSEFDIHLAPSCPEELTSPKLHRVLSYPQIQNLISGGKGVGSQGDGSAQFIARNEESQSRLIKILNLSDLGVNAMPLTINPF